MITIIVVIIIILIIITIMSNTHINECSGPPIVLSALTSVCKIQPYFIFIIVNT